jgi:hypothetical protein
LSAEDTGLTAVWEGVFVKTVAVCDETCAKAAPVPRRRRRMEILYFI